jgi:hypothetical protein
VVTPEMISEVMKDIGRRGGLATGEGRRAGTIPLSGAAIPKPTVCPRCGVEQPSARAAWVHCRKPKVKTKTAAKKKATPRKRAGKAK